MEIYINSIRFNNFLKFINEGLSSCLDSKYSIDFSHIVAGGFSAIKQWV